MRRGTEREVGVFVVESKFKVMHYQGDWPPLDALERSAPVKDRPRFTSDVLKRRVINPLRRELVEKTFPSVLDVKTYILERLRELVTEDGFGPMAAVTPTVEIREGRGGKFTELTFQWLDPAKDDPGYRRFNDSMKHLSDPWFAVRITKRI